MTQSIIFVPARNLTKSPTNVRKSTDPVADAQLEANIAARGVIQNLVGVPVSRKKGHFRITAGGRRLDSVHRLIEKGVFDPDYPVPMLALGNAKDAIEISLSENFFKLGMNPADACRAFQDIIETEKKSPADIAVRFGLTERFVLGRLRLAGLADPVFEALRDGTITLDIATAYASTSDIMRQASVFEQLSGAYYRSNVSEIRRMLASGSYKGGDPKALFVGREAYEEAGGRIDSDLFSDGESETWLDGDLLDGLATTRLAEAAEAIRAREGFAEIRAVAAAQVPYAETHALRVLHGEPAPLSPDGEERKSAIEAEIAKIERAATEADEYSEEQAERIEALEDDLRDLMSTPPIISADTKANALAYVVIGADGCPRVHEQLFVATASGADSEEEPGEEGGSDEPVAAGKPVHSQRLADELAMMKTELLAVHVASDPHFALDLGTFFMIEAATRTFGAHDMPSDLRANAPTPRVHGFESGTAAAEAWARLDGDLDRSWIAHAEIEQRYDAFCALDESLRAAWFGWAVARTLRAVPDGRTGSRFLDHIGCKLGIDVAAWWRPTARNYFDRVTKPAILDLLEKIGGTELRLRYGASKKHDLAASSEKLFAGQIIVEADVKERALAWLPEAMRFEVDAAGPCEDAPMPEEIGTGSVETGSERSAEPQSDEDRADIGQAA